jgi:hypothetical protein
MSLGDGLLDITGTTDRDASLANDKGGAVARGGKRDSPVRNFT